MPEVTVYTTRYCGYCRRAKAILDSKRVAYKEIPLDGDRAGRIELMKRASSHTVPQIWIGDQHIGGSDELYALHRAGSLDELLS
ncbi:MAG: glutaredoxin 3 [Agarilytica sp.]